MSESAEATSQARGTPGQVNGGGEASSGDQVNEHPAFRERLYASWWTWPLPVVAAVLLAAEIHMGYPGVRAWLPYIVLIPLAIAVPLSLGRTKVEVTGSELWVGDAHLPLRFVADAEVITADEHRTALGPDLDPASFVRHRPWIRTAVRVWLDDENDPTPYWVISTRRPEKLTDVLRQA